MFLDHPNFILPDISGFQSQSNGDDSLSHSSAAAILNTGKESIAVQTYPDSKVHGANMGPIWGRQGPGGPHVGPMNFIIWCICKLVYQYPTKRILFAGQKPLMKQYPDQFTQ